MLVFRDKTSRSGFHRFVEWFGLAVSLWVISRSGEVLSNKETAKFCVEFIDKLQAIICKVERKDAIRYDSLIEKDVSYIHRC